MYTTIGEEQEQSKFPSTAKWEFSSARFFPLSIKLKTFQTTIQRTLKEQKAVLDFTCSNDKQHLLLSFLQNDSFDILDYKNKLYNKLRVLISLLLSFIPWFGVQHIKLIEKQFILGAFTAFPPLKKSQ